MVNSIKSWVQVFNQKYNPWLLFWGCSLLFKFILPHLGNFRLHMVLKFSKVTTFGIFLFKHLIKNRDSIKIFIRSDLFSVILKTKMAKIKTFVWLKRLPSPQLSTSHGYITCSPSRGPDYYICIFVNHGKLPQWMNYHSY